MAAKANAKPLSRNPLRAVMLDSRLPGARPRTRKIAPPTINVARSCIVAASDIPAGSFQRCTLTSASEVRQKRKSGRLAIVTLIANTRTTERPANDNSAEEYERNGGDAHLVSHTTPASVTSS